MYVLEDRQKRLVAIAVLLIASGVVVGVTGIGKPAPAAGGYPVTIAPGISPTLTGPEVAAIARGYLDAQTPQAEGPPIPPVVIAEWATPARDAAQREPAVSSDAVAGQPDRVVWVVSVSGDVLNLTDLSWSQQSGADAAGNIVINDASGTILGVYPHDPPGFETTEPTSP